MNGVTDPGESYALLIFVLSPSILEILPREISDSIEKGQFPVKNSGFREKFAVLIKIELPA